MIAVTGVAALALGPGDAAADPAPWLVQRKTRKYMGVQDDLAVVCAGRALEQAGLAAPLGERAGLFVAVGYIPFEERDMIPVLEGSLVEGAFDHRRFAREGCQRAHPLLTFRCLPNMPAYHVSANFDLRGPYVVTYPGPAQLYQALEQATVALREGEVDVALVGGVAHQRNFLVEHHFARLEPPTAPEELHDAGAFIVLERETEALGRGARPLARLAGIDLAYEPFDPCVAWPLASQELNVDDERQPLGESMGAAALGIALAQVLATSPRASRRVAHRLHSRDGIVAFSHWELLP